MEYFNRSIISLENIVVERTSRHVGMRQTALYFDLTMVKILINV